MDISDPSLRYYAPPYQAPLANEVPHENVTMIDSKWFPSFLDVHRRPLFIDIDPNSPEDVGTYDLNVTIALYNYGANQNTYRLDGVLSIMVVNYQPCF